ncbi:hypothetical protein CHS0354_023955 [Potamilus streckersoni]|uniref:Rpn family recombination-promoting nuclease/putative transposase n=1 Tax=Potamilus streckersoni TaxID=2493646 RepID=A0AAE0RZP1_9BIVA|nr:hypothetical protein CHS0354_023955 [Potamilus streckersoni]
MVFLNPSEKYQNNKTPKKYQDWLDLLYASMKDPINYKLNLNNKGIMKVIQLIDYEHLDGETLRHMKEAEMRKEMEGLIKNEGISEGEKKGKMEGLIEDLFGVDVIVDKIETEKKFEPPISPINFELDIYAESLDHHFIIEIQKIDYDHNFDRFLHYFLTLISNQQKSSLDYKFEQKVLGVVIFARPYRFNTKDGLPIRDNVLIMEFNPRNLKGEFIKLYEHNMVFLNPSEKYQNNKTPKKYQDWLDLLYASMKDPINYKLNLNNKGIMKVIQLIDYEHLDGETLRQMKEAEMRKEMEGLIKNEGISEGEKKGKIEGRMEEKIEIIVQNYPQFSIEQLSILTKLSADEIKDILNQHKLL